MQDPPDSWAGGSGGVRDRGCRRGKLLRHPRAPVELIQACDDWVAPRGSARARLGLERGTRDRPCRRPWPARRHRPPREVPAAKVKAQAVGIGCTPGIAIQPWASRRLLAHCGLLGRRQPHWAVVLVARYCPWWRMVERAWVVWDLRPPCQCSTPGECVATSLRQGEGLPVMPRFVFSDHSLRTGSVLLTWGKNAVRKVGPLGPGALPRREGGSRRQDLARAGGGVTVILRQSFLSTRALWRAIQAGGARDVRPRDPLLST